MYADVEALLVDWLTDNLEVRVCTELPADLAESLPLLQVARAGGGDDLPTLDSATVSVDAFAASRLAASELAERARVALRLTLPGQSTSEAVVTQVLTITGPRWVPYDNTTLRRYNAAYLVRVKSHV